MERTSKMTFAEGCKSYLENCKQRNLREGTINHYRQSYDQFFRYFDPDMPLEEFGAEKYKKYVVHLCETLHNDVTINSYLRDLITTPVVSEKYGYSVRINEVRLLPEEITRIGVFHRQKLKKAVITICLDENYELNDSGCYRTRRLEENLYKGYIPEDYICEDVITYQWQQNREHDLQGHFNFYYSISKDSISKGSMFLYIFLLTFLGVIGNLLASLLEYFIGKLL